MNASESHRADLTSPDTFVAGVPHDFLARLRREDPVALAVGASGERCWTVTRHAEVAAASRETAVFSSELGPQSLPLINMDPPAHSQYRKLIGWSFTPKTIATIDRSIRDRAKALIAGALDPGGVDFVPAVAARLPLSVICDLLGIPATDHDLVLGWSTRLVASDDREINPTDADLQAARVDAFCYFQALAKERGAHPGEDLITTLMQSEVGGQPLPEAELVSFCILLLIGGNETTRNTLAHCALALAEHPSERQRLVDNPSLLPSAVEEILRFSSALMQARRTARTDATLGGQVIAQGDVVALWYASANRDEDVFASPNRLDVGRQVNPHVTFGGGGPHVCLGAHLARLQLRVVLEELLQQTTAIELLSAPVRLRSNVINGIKHLSLRLTA